MCKNCRDENGYTLLEMLVAFSLLLILVGTIIPLYIQMKQEEKNQEFSYEATALLHEKILQYKYDEISDENHELKVRNVFYQISSKSYGASGREWCVRWQNINRNWRERCDVIIK
ncbi:type II secretion system protein [Priestia megaterium]|nr:type II secretion system protein [Priestia megaterium]